MFNEILEGAKSKRDENITPAGYVKNTVLNTLQQPYNLNQIAQTKTKDMVTGIKAGVENYAQDVKDVYNRDPATGYGGFWSAAGKVLEDAGGAAYENPLDAALMVE